jgi:predicted metal-dependent HD superfamily phosphohydrolase
MLLGATLFGSPVMAKDAPTVKQAFCEIIAKYSDAATAERLWYEVDTSYSGPERHYHTLQHLTNFYTQLLKCKKEVKDWDILVVAMVYHDVVYHTPDHRDEERSAELAVKRLQECHFPEAAIRTCEALILATKSHALSQNPDTNLFNDADMSIVGLSPEVYREYVQNVGLEYGVTPQFRQGRKKVLQYFLSMDRIFKTNFFHGLYEEQARKNIAWEISTLP